MNARDCHISHFLPINLMLLSYSLFHEKYDRNIYSQDAHEHSYVNIFLPCQLVITILSFHTQLHRFSRLTYKLNC